MNFSDHEKDFPMTIQDLPKTPLMICKAFPLANGCLTMLVAEQWAGKTLVATRLELGIAATGEFLGFPITKSRGRIIHFDQEMGEYLLATRLLRIAKGLGVNEVPDSIKLNDGSILFDRLTQEDFEELVEYCRGASLIVFDSLFAFKSMGISGNSDLMGNIVIAMKQLALRVNCPVLLLHHFGKDTAAGPTGSHQIIAKADIVIYLEKSGPEGDEIYTLRSGDKNRVQHISSKTDISYKLSDDGVQCPVMDCLDELRFTLLPNMSSSVSDIDLMWQNFPREEHKTKTAASKIEGMPGWKVFDANWERLLKTKRPLIEQSADRLNNPTYRRIGQ